MEKKIQELAKNDIISIYLDNYKNPYQKPKCELPHNYIKLESEDISECSKCGSCAGVCWKCGKEGLKGKNREFCKNCVQEIKEYLKSELTL